MHLRFQVFGFIHALRGGMDVDFALAHVICWQALALVIQ